MAPRQGRRGGPHSDEDLAKAVGERIKEARSRAGLSQQELATKLEVTHTTLSAWECGYRCAPTAALHPLSIHLSVSVDWLVVEEEPLPSLPPELLALEGAIKRAQAAADRIRAQAARRAA